MKIKKYAVDQHNTIEIPEWLDQSSFLASYTGQIFFPLMQAIQEDDFLMGKTPKDLEFTWDEEE